MQTPIYQVDAFADQLFAGNPAAVVLPSGSWPDALMQSIAAENNLAETAFVTGSQEQGWNIRWFTPTVEVDLCGHATLAAAHVMFHHLDYPHDSVSFDSRSGPLQVRRGGDWLFLNFPADIVRDADPPGDLVQGLGATPSVTFRGRDDYLAIFESREEVERLTPRMDLVSQVDARGVIASAPGGADDGPDFVSRFFAPQSGVPEDSVTGSAHTALIPYWSKRLGKRELRARQISKRGGDLRCSNLGERVEIGGQSKTFFVGEIALPTDIL